MGLVDFYHYVMEECVDPRTKDWFLVQSPVPIVTILLLYSYLVFVGAPNYMRGRKPYSFKTYLQIYNFFQVVVNAYIVYNTAISGWLDYGFECTPISTSTTGNGSDMAVEVWNLYMIKLIDLSETIIFILRKKDRQVSFLHVYHHITTAFITWIFVKWLPGGGLALIIIINCSVHVVMYSYYLMSTGGPVVQSILAIVKPWITVIQMAQFVALVIHVSRFLMPSCKTPLTITLIVIADLLMNLLLFYNFFKRNYRKKKNLVKCD